MTNVPRGVEVLEQKTWRRPTGVLFSLRTHTLRNVVDRIHLLVVFWRNEGISGLAAAPDPTEWTLCS